MSRTTDRLRASARGRAEQTTHWVRSTRAKQGLWQVPGHFYSPIPAHPDELDAGLFDRTHRSVPGVELREEEQVELLRSLQVHYPAISLEETPAASARYYIRNDQYPCGDAAGYAMMLRHLRPARVLEIGSGYSTALALDMRDEHADLDFHLTCIEPYPERLRRLLREDDDISLVERRLEEVPLERFDVLGRGDILFVDSTHVAKLGSDVNYLFEQVLPRLAVGVVIHVHDVHWPFEYPRSWAEQGRAWNEAYVLRAFLQFNRAFQITLWPNYLRAVRPELFADMAYLRREVGSGIWLTRTA